MADTDDLGLHRELKRCRRASTTTGTGTTHASPRELGIMRKDDTSVSFLGSSSGIHFVRTVYNAFARRFTDLRQARDGGHETLVPGEDDHIRRGQRQVDQARIKVALQLDDKTFQACIIETQVILTKDHTKWNFDTLVELVEGPLLNSKRMEEAIKVSKFMRRLMSFFHPFTHRFSDIKKSPVSRSCSPRRACIHR